MLNRVHSGLNRVVRCDAAVDVHRHGHTRGVRLLNGRAQFFDRIVIGVVVEDQLDRAGAIVEVLAHGLADRVRAVGVEVFIAPEASLLCGNRMRLPAKRGNDFPAGYDRRSREHSGVDGAPYVLDRILGLVTDVAHGGESCGEQVARVPQAAQRPVRRAFLDVERLEWRIAADDFGQRQVRMRVHESRHQPFVRQVDDRRAGRDRELGANRRDLAVLDQYHLVALHGTEFRIYQGAGPDSDSASGSRRRDDQTQRSQLQSHRSALGQRWPE